MNEPVYFLKLELENVRSFRERVVLDLSDGNGNWKKWTVILGDNNTGKTTLLQALASLEIVKKPNSSFPTGFSYNYLFIDLQTEFKDDIVGLIQANLYIDASLESVDYQDYEGYEFDIEYAKKYDLSIKSYSKGSANYLGNFYLSPTKIDFKVLGYGASRVMSKTALSNSLSNNSETLFKEDIKLVNAEEWLLQLDYAASKDSEIKEFATNKRNQVKQILIDLLPDVSDIRFTVPTKDNLKSAVEFKTSFAWLTLNQLSLGYKTMIAWIVDLAARMFERYPDSVNPLAEPAIVLVDEIDLHLHPKWQRIIFDYLSDKFPQTQFIVTAHSPLIVQSAPKDANIVVLKKQGDQVIIDNDVQSVKDWRIDQIMTSDLFGFESSRSSETENWLEERRELIKKSSLSPEEKIRLKELNEKAHGLPTEENQRDNEAMEIIRKAATYLKDKQSASHD